MIFDCTGMMIIISSPSGAGKTTLVKLLSKETKILRFQFQIQHEYLEEMKLKAKIIILSMKKNLTI